MRRCQLYFSVSTALAAVFVDELGDEKDVVGAGEYGESEDDRVDGGQVVAGAVGHAGGEDNCGNRGDLDGGIDFPSNDGRKPRNPVTMLIAAAPTRMKTSRLMTATVTQKGTGRCGGKGCGKTALIDRTTKDVTSMSLSAIGSSMVPS